MPYIEISSYNPKSTGSSGTWQCGNCGAQVAYGQSHTCYRSQEYLPQYYPQIYINPDPAILEEIRDLLKQLVKVLEDYKG